MIATRNRIALVRVRNSTTLARANSPSSDHQSGAGHHADLEIAAGLLGRRTADSAVGISLAAPAG